MMTLVKASEPAIRLWLDCLATEFGSRKALRGLRQASEFPSPR